jgi:NAD(P)-dependent dehydrogenase (short-subunit alcohol dehydrogenase family)
MSSELRGQHAVVTGGGRGLGAAIATALAAAGADVTLMARDAAGLERRADELRSTTSGRVQAVVCDVTEAVSVTRAFAAAAEAFGDVRILVNNAGIAPAGPFAEITLETWQGTLAVNLTGAFLCAQRVVPPMMASGRGRIVNIASTAGLKGYASVAAYCASKHGVVGLTRALAAETASSGLTVNAVCPGYVDDTDMLRSAIDNVTSLTGRPAADARRLLERLSPRGTLVSAREVADTVRWLCSDDASGVTGQAIAVAGGEVMA